FSSVFGSRTLYPNRARRLVPGKEVGKITSRLAVDCQIHDPDRRPSDIPSLLWENAREQLSDSVRLALVAEGDFGISSCEPSHGPNEWREAKWRQGLPRSR